jgi:hypothetical protein
MSAICIHFCRLIACEMSDKVFNSGRQMFDKLFATAMNFFKNCLLNACSSNKPFLPNNCLTRIQTFHRLSEAYCLYNRVEWFYIGKFQNVNFEKPVVIKVPHGYNNKKMVLQLFKILRSSTRASALEIKFFLVEATF